MFCYHCSCYNSKIHVHVHAHAHAPCMWIIYKLAMDGIILTCTYLAIGTCTFTHYAVHIEHSLRTKGTFQSAHVHIQYTAHRSINTITSLSYTIVINTYKVGMHVHVH